MALLRQQTQPGDQIQYRITNGGAKTKHHSRFCCWCLCATCTFIHPAQSSESSFPCMSRRRRYSNRCHSQSHRGELICFQIQCYISILHAYGSLSRADNAPYRTCRVLATKITSQIVSSAHRTLHISVRLVASWMVLISSISPRSHPQAQTRATSVMSCLRSHQSSGYGAKMKKEDHWVDLTPKTLSELQGLPKLTSLH